MFGESSPTDPQQAAAKRKQLVFELNKNGQYLRLKEQLKAGVLRIVKEQYHKSGGMDRDEMQARHPQLTATVGVKADDVVTHSQGHQFCVSISSVQLSVHLCLASTDDGAP